MIAPQFLSALPRYKKLSRLRAYYKSKQYDGRADFFTGKIAGGKVVPLRDRKPCIIYPLPRAAVNQVVRFTFGQGRFPDIKVQEIDEKLSVAGEKLSPDEAKEIQEFIALAIERCNIKPGMRRIMRPGLAVGASCAIVSVKNGCFTLRVANVEDVQPAFPENDPSQPPTAITWVYQYYDTVAGIDGRPEQKRFWFRLDVTADAYIEYRPIEVVPNQDPNWAQNIAQTIVHNFGFCPVVWPRNVEDEDDGSIDGQSLYGEELFDEFDALNFALSQRHRGINYWGNPQPWETGVDEDDGPSADGEQASGPQGYPPARAPDQALAPEHGAVAARARRIGPANMWGYRSEKVRLGLLETTGKSFEAASLHVNDIRSRSLEAMSVVLVNVSEIMNRTSQGQMSAKFLELAYEPLLALVDEMRDCWWPTGLKAILAMILRIVAVTNGEGVWIPGAKNAAQILKRFTVTTQAGDIWLPPPMTPVWGDYFAAGQDEIAKAVDTAKKAEGLVPDEDRSRFVLPYFGREDVEDAVEEVNQENLEAQQLAQQQAQEAAKAAAQKPYAPNQPPGA